MLGLLHPGEMGASVGAAARAGGLPVHVALDGRSEATRSRARDAGLADLGSLSALVAGCDAIVSVCPPHLATETAEAVLALGFGGLYLDANAIAPSTLRELAGRFGAAEGGARLVDGGLIGPPAAKAGTTRLYLSGPDAPAFAECFKDGPLAASLVPGPLGAASALKMSFAAWTKGSAALMAAIVAVAEEEQVADALRQEWQISMPHLVAMAERGLGATARKAWRFEGEMHEIARTFAEAGLPPGFHEAAAEVYRRLAPYRDADPLPPDATLRMAVRRGRR